MVIESLHIISFGGLRNREFQLADGVNVLEGLNETGKSSAAMFIKFVFYGLSAKSNRGMSERQRYLNRETSQAAGYIMVRTDSGERYRLERVLLSSDDAPMRERVRIIHGKTGRMVVGQNPGEYFFGIPEEVFLATCFVSQSVPIRPEMNGTTGAKSGNAVENLLTTADENVDIGRAVRRLDTLRRELCHKNGTGGEIGELRARRGVLQAEEKTASEKAAERISVLSSLDDIRRRISELEEAQRHFEELFAALNVWQTGQRLEAAKEAEKSLNEACRARDALNDSPLSALEETLNAVEHDLTAYEEANKLYREMLPETLKVSSLPDNPESILEEAGSHETAAHRTLLSAIPCFIVAVFAFVLAGVLFWFNTDQFLLPALAGGVFLLGGVVFLAAHFGERGRRKKILDQWNVSSVEALDALFAEMRKTADADSASAENCARLSAFLDQTKIRMEEPQKMLQTYAEVLGLSASDNLWDTIGELRKVSEKQKTEKTELNARIDHLNGRLSVMREQLDGIDPEAAKEETARLLESPLGQTVVLLDADAVREAARERDFTESALRSALKRQSALEERLAEIGKLSRSPDEIATELSALEDRIEELTLRHDACELAGEALQKAGEALREDVTPRLAANASALIRDCSRSANFRHDRMQIDADFHIGLADGDDSLPAELLSRGTADLAYLALRIALAEEVLSSRGKEEHPILVLDESFAHMDAGRIRSFLGSLVNREEQYLIFTCRRDESEAAHALGCRVIRLNERV